jgi:hypothetical protein
MLDNQNTGWPVAMLHIITCATFAATLAATLLIPSTLQMSPALAQVREVALLAAGNSIVDRLATRAEETADQASAKLAARLKALLDYLAATYSDKLEETRDVYKRNSQLSLAN